MHPWILKKAESQDEKVQLGAKILKDTTIPYSTWSCEAYTQLLMRHGREIWHFLHWMTRKGYLPSIAPLRKGRKGIVTRIIHLRRGDPEIQAYACDPDREVRSWMSSRIKGNEVVLEFMARTEPDEFIRRNIAEIADVSSIAFKVLSVDESSAVRSITGKRVHPVLGDSLTYEYLFAAGAEQDQLAWFRDQYPNGIPVTSLLLKETIDKLYWSWFESDNHFDSIWCHVLRIYFSDKPRPLPW